MAYAAGGQLYYCYECQRTVRLNNTLDLVCPDCSGGFLEEWSAPEAAPRWQRSMSPWNLTELNLRGGAGDDNPYMMIQGLEAMSSFLQHLRTTHMHTQDDSNEDRGVRIRFGGTDVGGINPLLLFQSQMEQILGGNVEVFVDNGTGSGPQRLPINIGDYFFGPGLEQLIHQLSENDPNRHGAPPASKSAIGALPNIKVTEEILGTGAAQCAVCKDEFELQTEVKQMPCKHLYHPDCILPWLEQHNSCPVCRFELPTDDGEYEQTRSQGHQSALNGGGGEALEQGPSGFSVWGRPRQVPVARTREGHDAVGNGENTLAVGDSNGSAERGGFGIGRRFSLPFPWFRSAATTSQSPANAQAASSSQAYSGETVSSGPETERNEASGRISRASRTDDDGDTVNSETRLTDPE